MPELPEVETIRSGFAAYCRSKNQKVQLSDKKLRFNSTLNLLNLEGKTISKIKRRARYLIIDFKDLHSLIIHLGMSGKFMVMNEDPKKKHDHFIAELEGSRYLIFNDPRRFGFIDLVETKNLVKHKMLAKLGPEPLEDDFNEDYLAPKLQNKKMNIKTAMMDNELVVGVGNIYINESLFAAKISPLRLSSTLKKSEIKKLVLAIKNILGQAIKLGGSSINDYVDSKGEKGSFQQKFKIYGAEKKKCVNCSGIIKKIVQNGRSSFYCVTCQK